MNAPVRTLASPYARKLARERGITLALVTGSGPNGRIVADDLSRIVTTVAPEVIPAAVVAPEAVAAPVVAPARLISAFAVTIYL